MNFHFFLNIKRHQSSIHRNHRTGSLKLPGKHDKYENHNKACDNENDDETDAFLKEINRRGLLINQMNAFISSDLER